jgi:AcrR family transcriptional regulator
MAIDTPLTTQVAQKTDPTHVVRPRDASSTRQRLLEAARLRFARDGYSATTVRDLATDAGVNVALINRYFTSKMGLFEACVARAGEELGRTESGEVTVVQMLKTLISKVPGSETGERSLQLLLLLRSSGDERADEIRRDTLRSYSEGIARAAGWQDDDADGERIMLRAQIALAAALGIVVLRSSTGLEPLTSAGSEELSLPLDDLLTTVLLPSGNARP